MSRFQSDDFNATTMAHWEEKLWSTTDSKELEGFRQLLNGSPDVIHPATSYISVDESGIDSDEKRYEEETRRLLQAGFLTNERQLESLKQGGKCDF